MNIPYKGSRMLRTDEDILIKEFPPKKQGRSLFLGTTLDGAIQQYTHMLKLRERRCPMNTTIVRAGAKGIVNVKDKTRLFDHYSVSTLGKVIVKRMDFAK